MDRRRFLKFAALAAVSIRHGSAAAANFYSTEFDLTETPISEGGIWLGGKTVGLDWQDCRKFSGFATFTDINHNADDPTAILNPARFAFGPDQYVRVVARRPVPPSGNQEELQIRLRSTMAPHFCTGYEVISGSNIQIVRWNGPQNDYTVLNSEGPFIGVFDGDVVEATIVGNKPGVITVWVNGVQANRATDSTYTTGNPGFGFGAVAPAQPGDIGFYSFIATDSFGGQPPAAPTSLRVSSHDRGWECRQCRTRMA
jgi:hypothetical protein